MPSLLSLPRKSQVGCFCVTVITFLYYWNNYVDSFCSQQHAWVEIKLNSITYFWTIVSFYTQNLQLFPSYVATILNPVNHSWTWSLAHQALAWCALSLAQIKKKEAPTDDKKSAPSWTCMGLISPARMLNRSSRIYFDWFNIISLDWFF